MAPNINADSASQDLLKHLQKHGYKGIQLNPEQPVERLGGGYCRDSFRVPTTEGNFVITYFTHNWQKQSTAYIERFMQHLAQHDVPMAHPIGPFGRTGAHTAFEVLPFIEGHPELHPDSSQIALLGHALGKLHHASLSFDRESDPNPQSLRGWMALGIKHGQKVILGDEVAGISYALGGVPEIGRNISGSVQAMRDRGSLPYGAIQGDMNRQNVLWSEGKPVLLDFERARPSDFLYEVAKTLNEFVIIPGLEKGSAEIDRNVAVLLNAYHKERPFTAKEMEALPAMLRFCTTLAATKQSLMGMGRRYPALPQGVMLQNTVDQLASRLDFSALLETPTLDNSTYPTQNSLGRTL